MGSRSGSKRLRKKITGKRRRGEWVAKIDKDTGVVMWERKKINIENK